MERPEDLILTKYLKGTCSQKESELVDTWRNASTDHQEVLDRIAKIWESHHQLVNNYEPDKDAAWSAIQKEINSTEKQGLTSWVYRIAAVLIVGLGIGYFALFSPDNSIENTSQVAEVISATSGDVREVNLSDGSIITLNKGASISFDNSFGVQQRLVSLKGEAFFDIARDEDKPFIIKTNATTTTVLGTSFSINPTDEGVDVTVTSGRVSLESDANDEQVILIKGDRGRFSSSDQSVEKFINDDLNYLSWKTKQLQFVDAPIEQVLLDLEKYYEVQFDLEKEDVPRLTASFDDQSLEEVLQVISVTLDVQVNPSSTPLKFTIH